MIRPSRRFVKIPGGVHELTPSQVDPDRGLCNGRQGFVVEFVPSDTIQEPRPPSLNNHEDDYDGYRAATERHNRIVDYLKTAWSKKDTVLKRSS
ncbi:ATP-dependent DNA helicase pif1 [Colletotrichum sojae]|uniref:ATP-dependent DNA helicase pif1 n=1 Tax=Colletotrichum sojae TaxID=2175907 RepID=A0A8H6IRK3_9PEZI|nr:ATP-dependent DNA helicase pif1 [Colletotrichum sojae]